MNFFCSRPRHPERGGRVPGGFAQFFRPPHAQVRTGEAGQVGAGAQEGPALRPGRQVCREAGLRPGKGLAQTSLQLW